jgi:biopolymer transport protein ExbB
VLAEKPILLQPLWKERNQKVFHYLGSTSVPPILPNPVKTVMKKQESSSLDSVKQFLAGAIIVFILIVAIAIYNFVLGAPENFQGGDPVNGHPITEGAGKWLGTIYKGGFIVPILMSFFLMVFTFSIERFITISMATGSGSVDVFLRKVKGALAGNNIGGAIQECDKQKGSVGNVVKAILEKYQEMLSNKELDKEQKVAAIQKESEEAISLELPMLEKNLTIIATLASVATLTGLLGTVIGMIKAFSALATAGAPDAAALSNGISEALINTALGIGTSALAIIAYNYFTSKIDTLTYSIDEAGFSIIQSFNTATK